MKWLLVFLSGIALGLAVALGIVLSFPDLPIYFRYLV